MQAEGLQGPWEALRVGLASAIGKRRLLKALFVAELALLASSLSVYSCPLPFMATAFMACTLPGMIYVLAESDVRERIPDQYRNASLSLMSLMNSLASSSIFVGAGFLLDGAGVGATLMLIVLAAGGITGSTSSPCGGHAMPTIVFDAFPVTEIDGGWHGCNSGLMEAALWDPADNPHVSEICTLEDTKFRKKLPIGRQVEVPCARRGLQLEADALFVILTMRFVRLPCPRRSLPPRQPRPLASRCVRRAL